MMESYWIPVFLQLEIDCHTCFEASKLFRRTSRWTRSRASDEVDVLDNFACNPATPSKINGWLLLSFAHTWQMPRNTRIIRAASAEIDASVYAGCDVVLVDPPRAGWLCWELVKKEECQTWQMEPQASMSRHVQLWQKWISSFVARGWKQGIKIMKRHCVNAWCSGMCGMYTKDSVHFVQSTSPRSWLGVLAGRRVFEICKCNFCRLRNLSKPWLGRLCGGFPGHFWHVSLHQPCRNLDSRFWREALQAHRSAWLSNISYIKRHVI